MSPAPSNTPAAPLRECRNCNWYQAGTVSSTAGTVKIRACFHPTGPYSQEIVGALHHCEQFSQNRNGTNHR